MLNALWVFLGSGLGGVLRCWSMAYTYQVCGKYFPFGTLVVNILGSFVMGLLACFIPLRFSALETPLRALFLVGFLGGFTTFSAFSMDTLALFDAGKYFLAIFYILMSVCSCLISVWLGTIAGKMI
ncbi:MAG: fluoride efflux transporter CrcB [Gammaproteobacteria bacterium]|nr:fluoride efflux transporter CrcB [Gammaproteobacteria bacterium]MCD8524266.1 fluoride efflux transporter CrcB [Gammaproteobacteria bacterium]MCD8543252.1 fluoride efflux transporter CrcB [Gammaproteobacteria bacterium]